jgi:hypothetical protein
MTAWNTIFPFFHILQFIVSAKNISTNILEEFFLFLLYNFYAICISLNQFLLDWGIRLVVFGADCLSSGTERQKHTLTHLIYDCMQCSFPFFSHELTIIGTTMQRKQKFGPN